MQNQTPSTDALPQEVQGQPTDTTGPTEVEMPDANAIDERIKSGELRQDAEAAFGGQAEETS